MSSSYWFNEIAPWCDEADNFDKTFTIYKSSIQTTKYMILYFSF